MGEIEEKATQCLHHTCSHSALSLDTTRSMGDRDWRLTVYPTLYGRYYTCNTCGKKVLIQMAVELE